MGENEGARERGKERENPAINKQNQTKQDPHLDAVTLFAECIFIGLGVGGKHLGRWDSVFSSNLKEWCPRSAPDEFQLDYPAGGS